MGEFGAVKKEKYAMIVVARMQVDSFTDNPESYVGLGDAVIAVDMQTHPQKDEVQEDWFYNPETNRFSEEGEIHYPEIESVQPGPTPGDLYQAATLLNQAEILANQRQQDKVMAAILLEQVGGEANV